VAAAVPLAALRGDLGAIVASRVYTPYTAAPLSRDIVIEAALEIAEREGLERLSMRRVAAALGVSTMAPYRHVRNKQDLLDGLLARLLAEVELPEDSLSWDRRLRLLAGEIRALARRRPRVFALLLQRRAAGEGATRARRAALSALADAGLDERQAASFERIASTMIMGLAMSEAAGRFHHEQADRDFQQALAMLEAQLRR
jgi:AcrR family transcriptional regulator